MQSTTFNEMYRLLAWLGALPFIGCALLNLLSVESVGLLSDWPASAASYGLAIVSFMAGVHWGQYLERHADCPINLLITSNVVTVAAWLAYLFAPVRICLLVLAGGFLALLLIDYLLLRHRLISGAYFDLRRNVTLVVVAALAATGVAP